MTPAPKAIVVENLSRQFGAVRAVDGLSFEADYGELIGLLGPNGAGKTTAMRLLSTYLQPSSGQAAVAGFDVKAAGSAVRELIGYLPENSPLYGEMSVIELLHFVAKARQISPDKFKSSIVRVLDLLNLNEVKTRRIEELSKGFKRRVGLAQALIHEPKILILDEPSDGLDPNQKFELRGLLQQLATSCCVIISTHDLDEVQRVCSRVLIIGKGKLLADGTVHDVLAKHTSEQHSSGEHDLDHAFRSITQ